LATGGNRGLGGRGAIRDNFQEMSSATSGALGRKIAQSTGIVMASVLLSRLLGFCREWAVAHQVGSNAVTDAYYAAFTLPDFLNYLVAAGSLSVTFIPVFSKYLAEKDEEEGWRVFSIVVAVMGTALVALLLAAEIFAPYLAKAIAPGFKPTEMAQLIFLTRLMLPAQFCFYMGGILSAVQYAKGQFVVPSLAPLVYNALIIMCGVALAPKIGITGFAVGVVIGAILGNFLLQVYGARRAGARFFPSFNWRHPGFKLFVKLAVPIMLALSLSFTDDWIIRWFGSYLVPASITWLSYAKILMRVPLGMVGQAIGVASFPILAQLYSEKRLGELNEILNGTIRGMIVLLVPISALTMALSVPLVHLVFSHTRLTETDLLSTAATLVWFSVGMFAWGAQNILARGFYATHNTITPAVVGTVLTGLNIPIYWLLVRRDAHIGLAMASTIGITVYMVVLFVLLARRTHDADAWGLVWFLAKVTASSAIAAFACNWVAERLNEHIPWRTTHGAFVDLCVAAATGVLLMILFAKIFRVREVDEYLNKAARRLARAF
jgi:putative peptidoglycan lipid II flippase